MPTVATRLGPRHNEFAEFRVSYGPFAGFETAFRLAEDGSLHAPDLPPGSMRVRLGDREYRFDGSAGDRRLPPWEQWTKRQ